MSVYFLLTLISITSSAKPVIVPVAQDKYLTIDDLQSLKIGFLIFIITSLLHLVRWIWSFFSGERKDLSERVKNLEKTTDLILNKLDNIMLSQAQLKDGQISESEIRNIVREEEDYIAKVKQRQRRD